ncbi:FGGY-family carbohydrate kinase [Microbulbifer rhizosphaerae]|uniref:Sugar (Pentulose or hexulose) kinase n=1 Tax=Microbulbifer rhizosphaerae TaxID=1562603 RepID=A0A7W4WBL3_9GAMM|nr:FGGY family carbohydrate kinase [Microbulbifer rhizosphaerae]MBB3061264.1 sugar (pentulose or hexulose) kinase [Microbulbifer rhizosphaerae]
MSYKLVLDVGKTHVKLHLLNNAGESVFSRQTDNRVLSGAPYPHFDIEGLWQWMLRGIGEAAQEYLISAVSITTHGAAAALINRHGEEAGLVLPVLDYEYTGIESCNPRYDRLRPEFSETYSPALPAGLNLGRQLYWQRQLYPEAFARATDILMYPQYWAWRLTGQCCSEVTSLGCHTDLWSPATADFSSLVENLRWRHLFPRVVPAWTQLGCIRPEIGKLTGLPDSCRVFAGVHDSNASFLRYRATCADKPFTVISTGTWSILMVSGTPLEGLKAGRDMLANVDVTGQPVACARFMGGREYAAVCKRAGAAIDEQYGETELQKLIDAGTMALPDFSGGSGPFPGRDGRLEGVVPTGCGAALASLYCALMLDYLLDLLGARGDIFVEGAFLKNPILCALLAQLRGHQQVWLSADDTGTVQGCASLVDWVGGVNRPLAQSGGATRLKKFEHYKQRWRRTLELEAVSVAG